MKKTAPYIIMLIFLAFAVIASVCAGAVKLNFVSTLKLIFFDIAKSGQTESTELIIIKLRLARAILAACVGASLASSGAVFQGLFRNPLADPYVIGSSSGASLGAVSVIVFGGSFPALLGEFSALGLAAFVGGLLATFIVYTVAKVAKLGGNAASLLLAGSALSSFFSALVSVILALRDKDLHRAWFWLLGGFSGRGFPELLTALPALIIGFVASVMFSRILDLLSLGDEEALSLGLKPERARLIIGFFASLSVSSAVALSGSIGFVGLIAPHIARKIVGSKHLSLIPASALVGAIMLVLADIVSRTVFAPMEMPVGAMTALIGSPFFIWKIARSSKVSKYE